MLNEAKAVYSTAREEHATLFERLNSLRHVTRNHEDRKELVDAIYALKQTKDILEDSRKDLSKLEHELEVQVCKLCISLNDIDPIKTEFCTGTADIKEAPKTPKEGTPEYDAFCRHFGVDPASPFKPHWNKVIERVEQDAAEGKPLPPGVDVNESWQIMAVRTRKRMPVLEGDPAQFAPARLKDLYALVMKLLKLDFSPLQELSSVLVSVSDIAREVNESGVEEPVVVGADDEETPF